MIICDLSHCEFVAEAHSIVGGADTTNGSEITLETLSKIDLSEKIFELFKDSKVNISSNSITTETGAANAIAGSVDLKSNQELSFATSSASAGTPPA